MSRISEPTALTNDRSSRESPESDADPLYKARLPQAAARDTALSALFDVGWPASLHRVVRNSTYQRWSPSLLAGPRTRWRRSRRVVAEPVAQQRPMLSGSAIGKRTHKGDD